jgi:thiosulfate/3-mercaptopyruvate sulfurtransferase
LEISKPEEFAKGHLPGAINTWRPAYEDKENYPYGGIRASRPKMVDLLRKMGVKNDSLLVIYCTKGSADATRFMWIMREYGHDKIAMIDGGKTAWQHAGLPLTQDTTPSPLLSSYRFPAGFVQTNDASFHDVIAAISDTNTIILDTREEYEYLGTPYITGNKVVDFKPGGFISGAIPGAIHLNWSESVDLHGDHTFKSLKDLAYNFKNLGINPDKKIIVYCQSGVRSSHTAFVLSELLGYPDVSNYDGSWIEWSYLHVKVNLVPVEQHTSAEATKLIHENLVATLTVATTE